MKYITFLVNDETVGIKYSSSYLVEETHINKTFIKNGYEYIHYKGIKVPVVDTGKVIHNKPLRKFDGLIFITFNKKIIAFKTEGFFKCESKVDRELDPSAFF